MEALMSEMHEYIWHIIEYISDGGLMALYTRDRTKYYDDIIRKQMHCEFSTRIFPDGQIPAIVADETVQVVMADEQRRCLKRAAQQLEKAAKAAVELQIRGYSPPALAAWCNVSLDNEALQAALTLVNPKQRETYARLLSDPATRDTALTLAQQDI